MVISFNKQYHSLYTFIKITGISFFQEFFVHFRYRFLTGSIHVSSPWTWQSPPQISIKLGMIVLHNDIISCIFVVVPISNNLRKKNQQISPWISIMDYWIFSGMSNKIIIKKIVKKEKKNQF